MCVANPLTVRLLPTEEEWATKRRRWKVNEAAFNVTQLNAAGSNTIDARLHLINKCADAHLNERTRHQRLLRSLVGAGRLEIALITSARSSASAFQPAESEQLLLQAFKGGALLAQECDQGAQIAERLCCRLKRPFTLHSPILPRSAPADQRVVRESERAGSSEVEQGSFKPLVAGSNPARLTNKARQY